MAEGPALTDATTPAPKRQGNISFAGTSGRQYAFQVWPMDTRFKPVAAVYFVTKRAYRNRTYHTALDMTPYQAWTGRIPCLDRLITFGSKITARRGKARTTATDPNAFQGIFLGYRATMDNLIYWDTKAQCRRTAKHHVADELQYGDPPNQRSPASKYLIEIVTGTPHQE